LDKSYNIFEETKTACTEINVSIPEVKRHKISTKFNYEHHSQYLFKNTKKEMKITVYNGILDKIINGIKAWFS